LPRGELIRIFIESKKGYDNSSDGKELKTIYNLFDAESFYTTNFFSDMFLLFPLPPMIEKYFSHK